MGTRTRRRNGIGWNTRFGRWVSDVGIGTIVEQLAREKNAAVTPQAVYSWVYGVSSPRRARAQALEKISSGRLTLDEIYNHTTQVRSHEPTVKR